MKENNIKIYQNPNAEELQEIIEAVEANDGYCPCALEKTSETKCMCQKFKTSQEVDFCHCGRFYKIKEFETLALVGDISEDNGQFEQWEWLLNKQNFIIIPVKFDRHNIYCHSDGYRDLSRTKIAKSDAVFILDEEVDWLIDIEVWADAIGKRVLHRSDLQS